jgi:hypothetical protein
MVFWLNIGFVMIYTRLGAQELDLLINRPYTTLLGALVAAGVVLFIFPIHIGDRFTAAATQFLGAVDGYVAAFVAVATCGSDIHLLDPAQAKVLATYTQLEQTLPSVAFENFPFVQADSPLTQQGTQLAALEAEVGRLVLAAKEHGVPASNTRIRAGMCSLQEHIHQAIQVAIPRLGEERRWRRPTTARQQSGTVSVSAAPAGNNLSAATTGELPPKDHDSQWLLQGNGGLALLSIYNVVTQLADGLGRPVSQPGRAR